MQITSGMAGAFSSATGDIDPQLQSHIASDYVYNIAFGARMLAEKWASTPKVDNRNPSAIENWYYALWAYNGWGWVNNPNNPRFARTDTPATDPAAFPYQERVLYLVAHPPHDQYGGLLWTPMQVTLPSRSVIGKTPGALMLGTVHPQPPPALSAVYQAPTLPPIPEGGRETVRVQVVNTGTEPWGSTGTNTVALAYHVFDGKANPYRPFSPLSPGVVAFGQDETQISRVLAPGQSATVTATIQAPRQPGSFKIAWDLEEGGSLWFSASGALPGIEPLTVLGPAQTPRPTSTPTPTATVSPPESMRYLADTATADQTTVSAGAAFEKGWLVFNDGQQGWPVGTKLRHIAGPSFGAPSIAVTTTPPCHSAVVVAAMRAPTKAGVYRSRWRLADSTGHLFGDPLTVVIVVRGAPGGAAPTPPPLVPTPTTTPTRRPSSTPTPVG